MNTQELLASAVKKLGPVAAQNALLAFGRDDNTFSFAACGLAYAFGAPGELLAAMDGNQCYALAAPHLGLTDKEVAAFAQAFDGFDHNDGNFPFDAPECRVVLRTLLEAEAAKIRTAPAPQRAVPETAEASA